MKLIDYIKGERRGVGARGLELEALRDPFLCEALRGYDSCGGAGSDCIKALTGIDQDLSRRSFARRRRWALWLTVGALALALLCIVFFVVTDKNREESGKITPPVEEKTEAAPTAGPSGQLPLTEDAAAIVNADDTPVADGEGMADMPGDGHALAVKGENLTEDTVGDRIGTPEDVPADGQVSVQAAAPPIFAITLPDAQQAAYVAQGMKYLSVPAVGHQKFNEYLLRAMVLPEDGERGEVAVSFRVNRYGRPSEIRVERSFFQPAGREAIRLLTSGPEWTPTDQRVEVTFFFRDK